MTNYWLWIIPLNYAGLWAFCRQNGVAAMQYEADKQGQALTKRNVDMARQIAAGDQIVAYLNNRKIGAIGTVTRPFYDDQSGYSLKSEPAAHFGQRVGVTWQSPKGGGYLDLADIPVAHERILVGSKEKPKPVLVGATVHPIDRETFEAIAAALEETANPLDKLADLLESTKLDDPDVIKAKRWDQKVGPITRPVLEAIDQAIKNHSDTFGPGLSIAYGRVQDVKLAKQYLDSFQLKGPDIAKLSTNSLGVWCGFGNRGLEKALVWGAVAFGDDGQIHKASSDFEKLRQNDEQVLTSRIEVEGRMIFGGQDCLLCRYLSPAALRGMNLDELSERIANDLADVYRRLNDGPPPPPNGSPITQLERYVQSQRFSFPRDLLTTYYLALRTKPFVILTGISGTGKTKLAQLFAEWMSQKNKEQWAFVPVRPDWTDNRGLLGFHNLITQSYQGSDLLSLLLRATVNGGKPHFVILDEMNLAKVEYYFADFLSAIESRRAIGDKIVQESIPLHSQPRCVVISGYEEKAKGFYDKNNVCTASCSECPYTTPGAQVKEPGFDPLCFAPPRLAVPLNVYFAGTVNVDETTYMFSPKVLDRANTIEFDEVDLRGYFSGAGAAGNATCADDAAAQDFSYKGQFVRLPKQEPELSSTPELAPYRERLIKLVDTLKPFGMHFGYRVADEILLYLWNAKQLNEPGFDLDKAFDRQVYQKILPKFHGSQARLQEPLKALKDILTGLPASENKLQRMLDQLQKEGFASFA
jgi:energy-coupling factor transporter ATP-binding protein EcfA2